jgi:hypothetical protein
MYPMQQRGGYGVRPNAANECAAWMRKSYSFHRHFFDTA